MILLHQQRRGLSDDSAPRLLSTRDAGPTLVVAHAATPLAQSTRCRSQDTPPQSIQSKRKRSREPKPFAGLTPPPCALCAQQTAEHTPAPPLRPNPMPLT